MKVQHASPSTADNARTNNFSRDNMPVLQHPPITVTPDDDFETLGRKFAMVLEDILLLTQGNAAETAAVAKKQQQDKARRAYLRRLMHEHHVGADEPQSNRPPGDGKPCQHFLSKLTKRAPPEFWELMEANAKIRNEHVIGGRDASEQMDKDDGFDVMLADAIEAAHLLLEQQAEERGLDHSLPLPDSQIIRDPSSVPLAQYVRAQLRALRHSLEHGYGYHLVFDAHTVGLAEEKRLQLAKTVSVSRNINYVAENKLATQQMTPVKVWQAKKQRESIKKNRSDADDFVLSRFFASQIELRRQRTSSTELISGGYGEHDDVFTIVSKKWAAHVVTVITAQCLIDQVQSARDKERKRRKEKQEADRRAGFRDLTVQEKARYWRLVRSKLRDYIIRYKRQRYNEPANLLVRFFRHYRHMQRLVTAIPGYRSKVVIIQRQVRVFFRMREARRVLLLLQYIRRECQILNVENKFLTEVGSASALASKFTALNLRKNQTNAERYATIRNLKEKRRQVSRNDVFPGYSVYEIAFVPDGGTPQAERLNLIEEEVTKLMRHRMLEIIQYSRLLKFYREESQRYHAAVGTAATTSSLPNHQALEPPKEPVRPLFSLFLPNDILTYIIRAHLPAGFKKQTANWSLDVHAAEPNVSSSKGPSPSPVRGGGGKNRTSPIRGGPASLIPSRPPSVSKSTVKGIVVSIWEADQPHKPQIKKGEPNSAEDGTPRRSSSVSEAVPHYLDKNKLTRIPTMYQNLGKGDSMRRRTLFDSDYKIPDSVVNRDGEGSQRQQKAFRTKVQSDSYYAGLMHKPSVAAMRAFLEGRNETEAGATYRELQHKKILDPRKLSYQSVMGTRHLIEAELNTNVTIVTPMMASRGITYSIEPLGECMPSSTTNTVELLSSPQHEESSTSPSIKKHKNIGEHRSSRKMLHHDSPSCISFMGQYNSTTSLDGSGITGKSVQDIEVCTTTPRANRSKQGFLPVPPPPTTSGGFDGMGSSTKRTMGARRRVISTSFDGRPSTTRNNRQKTPLEKMDQKLKHQIQTLGLSSSSASRNIVSEDFVGVNILLAKVEADGLKRRKKL